MSDVELPSNRKFGLFFSFIFLITSVYFYSNQYITIFILFSFLFILTIIFTILSPNKLLPLNKIWMKFGFIIGMLISPIILGIIFFLLISPVAIITRIFGRDELFLKRNDVIHWTRSFGQWFWLDFDSKYWVLGTASGV